MPNRLFLMAMPQVPATVTPFFLKMCRTVLVDHNQRHIGGPVGAQILTESNQPLVDGAVSFKAEDDQPFLLAGIGRRYLVALALILAGDFGGDNLRTVLSAFFFLNIQNLHFHNKLPLWF